MLDMTTSAIEYARIAGRCAGHHGVGECPDYVGWAAKELRDAWHAGYREGRDNRTPETGRPALWRAPESR